MLDLSTASTTVGIAGSDFDVSGRLGSLSLTGISNAVSRVSQSLLSIEGENFVDFKYSVRAVAEDQFQGVHSDLTLHSASIIIHFHEQPLRDVIGLVRKLAHMKELYDAATQAAAESAASISRLQFDIEIQSPVIILPVDSLETGDRFVVKLGKLEGKNKFEGPTNQMAVALRGIHVESILHKEQEIAALNILEDVSVEIQIEQNGQSSPTSKVRAIVR